MLDIWVWVPLPLLVTFARCEDQPVKRLVLWEGQAGKMLWGKTATSLTLNSCWVTVVVKWLTNFTEDENSGWVDVGFEWLWSPCRRMDGLRFTESTVIIERFLCMFSTGVMTTVCCRHKQVTSSHRAQWQLLHAAVVCVQRRRQSRLITWSTLQLRRQWILQ